MRRVCAPFVKHPGYVRRDLAVERDLFFCAGMNESESLGVKSLPWKDGEAIVDELLVFGVDGPFQDPVSTIAVIVEQRMPYIVHMNPYLVGTAGLKLAFYKSDITESFEDAIVCDGVSADTMGIRPQIVITRAV